MKKLLTAALATLMTVTPSMAKSSHSDHVRLFNSVKAAGVSVYINPSKGCDPRYNGGHKIFGYYAGRIQTMVICQETALRTGQFDTQHDWTEEDYDTLRHEAHHLVQDCRDNSLDARLHAVYREPLSLAKNTLSTRKIEGILKSYGEQGEHMVVMELEAFSVAQLNDPLEQVSDIQTYCF